VFFLLLAFGFGLVHLAARDIFKNAVAPKLAFFGIDLWV
jgi:hypothetical protein